MRVVIVYESLFGNTREVAEAIAEGVQEADKAAEVECVRVDAADPGRIGSPDLLVVGGPTHMRGMTSGMSRKMGLQEDKKEAAKEAEEGRPHRAPEEGAEGPGVRGWLHKVPKTHGGTHAAAFDTRVESRMAGGAAKSIAHKLRDRGYRMAAEPEGFIVDDLNGPLRAGERERAKAWGTALT
ncbi:flavodoxin family protein [Yinghuangia sp. YIM S10712]|uniref:flavodoxin family protein n=1 Tax=Yinghuangia sp. YIM S10712 TaxID=3436930 RepID=UPI003F52EDC1